METVITALILGVLALLPIVWLIMHLNTEHKRHKDIAGWIKYSKTAKVPSCIFVQVIYRNGSGYIGISDDVMWGSVSFYRILEK